MYICSVCKTNPIARRSGRCPPCNAEYLRAYRARNADAIRAGQRDHYLRNRDNVKSAVKRYRETNPHKVKAQQALSYKNNREHRLAAIKAWQKANPEKYKESLRRGVLNRIARKHAAEGKFTAADIRAIGNLQRWACANPYCKIDLIDGYHIDHNVPLSRGGNNWPANLQLLCPSCNCRKHAKTMDEFLGTYPSC
jgi:5-methylcytosine-specific restriction endonuclease McrA